MRKSLLTLLFCLICASVSAQGLGSGGIILLSGKGATGATGTNILTSINYQTSTYTLTLNDMGGLVEMNTTNTVATAVQSILIPASNTVAFPLGAQINVVRFGAGEVRIAGVAPVVVLSVASPSATPWLLQTYSGGTCVYLGTDTWIFQGHCKDSL